MATAKKLPSGNYRIRIYDSKTKRYLSFTAETKKLAEKMAADYQVGHTIKASCVTIRDRAEEYISLRTNTLSPATIDKYRESIDTQLSCQFLSIMLNKLTDKDIVAEVNRLAGRYSPKTIRNTMAFILPIIREERPDLARHIELPKVQKKMKDYPRAAEIIRLFKGDHFELEILLALCLGLRKEEIRGLKPSDLKDGILTINRVKITVGTEDIVKEEAKTVDSRRRIALPPFILRLFEARTDEYILMSSGHALYMHYKRKMEAAGYKNISFHDLRHINASEMIALRVPDKYAMERGGWVTDTILKSVYQSTFSEERLRYDAIIDAHFQNIYDTKYDTTKEQA